MIYLHYVKQHKNGAISDDVYFKKCVDAIEHTWAKQEDIT